jgi:hypothetical protein
MDRRTVEELLVRYELEPGLHDVFVEGTRDAALIEWVAAELGLRDVVAYDIGTVSVPPALVSAHAAENNNRGRVIALARELELGASNDLYNTVVCVVDGDLDYFENVLPAGRLLVVTDGTAMELYLYDETTLRKFTQLVLGRSHGRISSCLPAIQGVLQSLFAVRVAAKRLGVALALVDFVPSCRVNGAVVAFDLKHFVGRYIRRQEYARRHDEFLAEVVRVQGSMTQHPLVTVHGHDFVSVLHWYMKSVARIGTMPPEAQFAPALFGCIDIGVLRQSRLGSELVARFA